MARTPYKAVHEIHTSRNDKLVVVPAGSVFEFTQEEADDLLPKGAIVEVFEPADGEDAPAAKPKAAKKAAAE